MTTAADVITPARSPEVALRKIGPRDHGLSMTLEQFEAAEFVAGWRYELARGVVIVTDVPGIAHGRIVDRVTKLFVRFDDAHPGVIDYRAAGSDCRLRLAGMQSDRHPDQAIYLTPPPPGPSPWLGWCPELVVEVVSDSGGDRDYVEKREEYLRAGVREYWIVDPRRRRMLVLRREVDTWAELVVEAGATYRCDLLPGLEVRPVDLIGPEPGAGGA